MEEPRRQEKHRPGPLNCKLLPRDNATLAPSYPLGWIGAQSRISTSATQWDAHGCRQQGNPISRRLNFIPAPTGSCVQTPGVVQYHWSGSVPLELSHTAGLGCRRKDAAGTREMGIPACSEYMMRGFQLPFHPDCACKVAKMQGHCGLLRRGTSVSSTPMSEQGVRSNPSGSPCSIPKRTQN